MLCFGKDELLRLYRANPENEDFTAFSMETLVLAILLWDKAIPKSSRKNNFCIYNMYFLILEDET
jgi:hypothetical protein